jgi:phosphatidylinositol dimannoside acyltransferase
MIVSESIARDCLRLVVWYPLRWIVLLVPARWGIAVLRLLGDIQYGVSRGKRAQLAENYRRLIPNPDASESGHTPHVIRAYFRNHFIDHLMIFIFPKMGDREIEELVEFEGLNHLNRALSANRGVILVHGHFGPVHLPLVCLSRIGYPMMQIGMPSDEGLSRIGRMVAFRLRMKYEAKLSADIVHARSFLRPVIRWLKQNGVVMITGDGSGTADRVGRYDVFDFFGHRVSFPLGPALMAKKADSLLLPLFIVPGKKKMYRVVIDPPINADGEKADIHAIVRKFIRRLEFYVSQWPGYMHFLDRFEAGQWIETERHRSCKTNRNRD